MKKVLVLEKTAFKFKVNVWEYERGWGSKIDDVREFDTYELATDFIDKFNSSNTELVVPDWYMVAKPDNFIIKDVQN